MNVMKQNAMDDKIIERCKTCKKQCTQEDLDGSRVVELLSSRSQPRWIEQLSSRPKVSQWIEKLSSLIKKTFFQREEKHTEKNAIKQATQPNIQTTY